jgi:hypothetical protein
MKKTGFGIEPAPELHERGTCFERWTELFMREEN